MITTTSLTTNNILSAQTEALSTANNSQNGDDIKMFEQDEEGHLHMTDAGKAVLIVGGIYIFGECLDGANSNDKEILEQLEQESEEAKEATENKITFGEIVVDILFAWFAKIAKDAEAEK